jgi:hypothetical protein
MTTNPPSAPTPTESHPDNYATATWNGWNNHCRTAARHGHLVTDHTTRIDYPGSDEGWQNLVDIDDRIRAHRQRQGQV